MNPVVQVRQMDVDYLMEFPLQFTGLYKTRINVKMDGIRFCLYYNIVNQVIDLLAGFGFYANKSNEFFCKSDNV